MSAEEKRQTLLGIFHETKDVFTLKVGGARVCSPAAQLGLRGAVAFALRRSRSRPCLPPATGMRLCALSPRMQDIEKLGSKRGVVQQTIKDVLQVGAALGAPRAGLLNAPRQRLPQLGVPSQQRPGIFVAFIIDSAVVHQAHVGAAQGAGTVSATLLPLPSHPAHLPPLSPALATWQSLVDDDLVHQERIGASNYFWSFPGEAAAKVAGEIAKLEKRLQVGAGWFLSYCVKEGCLQPAVAIVVGEVAPAKRRLQGGRGTCCQLPPSSSSAAAAAAAA